jgi:hypothetical protein
MVNEHYPPLETAKLYNGKWRKVVWPSEMFLGCWNSFIWIQLATAAKMLHCPYTDVNM